MNWLTRLIQRDRLESQLDAELRDHFERLVLDFMQAGVSEREARRRARLQFGGLDQVKELCRDARGTRWVEETMRDIRFAARILAKDRWFAAAAVTALSLGLAVSNTVFTVVNALVIRGLPVENAHRVAYLGTQDATGQSGGVSYLDYVNWRSASRTFNGLAAFSDTMMTIADADRAPDRLLAAYISSNAFQVLGQRPFLGRDFVEADDLPGAAAVAILGYATWVTRYGADPAVVGSAIDINGTAASVVGVMPDGFRFPVNAELWQPLSQLPGLFDHSRSRGVLGAFGRFDRHVSLADASAELNTIAAGLGLEHPETNTDIRPVVMPFNERYTGRVTEPIYLALFGAVACVLLIACANVANLLLVRSATRTREMSMRLSLGASRWRIVRQLLIESLVLTAVAGVLALGLSALSVRALSATAEGLVKPYWIHFTMDWRVFVALAVVCLGTALGFGLAPALRVSRADASEILKSGRTFTDTRSRRWAGVVITAELTLALMLLASAGLMLQSVRALARADRVIDTRPLLTMRLALPVQKYPTPDQRRSFLERLEQRLEARRTIPSATIAGTVPFTPTGPPRRLSFTGQVGGPSGGPANVSVVTVGGQYFETLGLQLLRGRTFTAIDGTPGHQHVIINQRLATMYFSGEDPVGRQIFLTDPNAPRETARTATVIGVSPSVRQNMGAEVNPVVYVPYRAESGPVMWLIVRSGEDRGSVVAMLREEVRTLDSSLPLFGIMTMDQVLTQTLWPRRAFSAMFLIFASIALLLAAVGLYAVTAYSVTQRTQELGIRMALGADAGQVWWLVVRQTFWQLGIGSALGAAGAVAIGKLLQAWLIETSPTDVRALLAATALLGLTCVAAALRPARRATQIDPVVALRYE